MWIEHKDPDLDRMDMVFEWQEERGSEWSLGLVVGTRECPNLPGHCKWSEYPNDCDGQGIYINAIGSDHFFCEHFLCRGGRIREVSE